MVVITLLVVIIIITIMTIIIIENSYSTYYVSGIILSVLRKLVQMIKEEEVTCKIKHYNAA